MIIGISTHTIGQALRAEEGGADYVGFGPVFITGTKYAGRPKGLQSLSNVTRKVNVPVVAIGGINAGNVRDVLRSGVDACAVVSGILGGSIGKNTKEFLHAAADQGSSGHVN